ncbi:MAG: TonB family protein [Bryobacteraceae bacterium]|jgi:protein TonB
MALRVDILDQPESLRRPFWGSVLLHVSLVLSLLAATWIQARRPRMDWGDIHGGGLGAVAVNVVSRIPLPTESGPVNPVASDTQSRVPEPPPQAKTPPKAPAKAPLKDLDSIPLTSRNALRKPAQAASPPNKFRAAQKDLPNQAYSQAGQRLVAPDLVGRTGGGDVELGDNSPFGTKFGAYTGAVKNRVAQHWKTGEINPRIRTANPVVVTFTIRRDGSSPQDSVKIRQSSGIMELDMSAQRAIMEAAPFPPLPAQFSGSSVDVEFWFTLRR